MPKREYTMADAKQHLSDLLAEQQERVYAVSMQEKDMHPNHSGDYWYKLGRLSGLRQGLAVLKGEE